MNRKGNVGEVTFIVVSLFAIAIVAVIILAIVNSTKDAIVADDVPQVAKDIITTGNNSLPGMFDFWFVLFLVGLPLISAVLAFFNNIHPLFFWLSLGLVVIAVMVGAGISVFWSELAEDALLSTHMDSMPMANYILQNFAIYSLFVFIIVASGTFIKLRAGQQGFGGSL